MNEPKRIQRKRTKGWRMPEGAVYVGRPTKWGNPFRIVPGYADLEDIFAVGAAWPCPSLPAEERRREVHEDAVARYRHWITHGLHVAVTTVPSTHIRLPPAKSVVVWTCDPPETCASRGSGRCSHPARLPSETSAFHQAPADLRAAIAAELAGRDLACWCPPSTPCHADVLLELANAPGAVGR